MHSIKSRNLKSFLLKVDLTKAYHCIEWEFLKLILIKAVMSSPNIDWIMACIKITHFVVIINGLPSHFFSAHRGLR